jgi:hypothetical protein
VARSGHACWLLSRQLLTQSCLEMLVSAKSDRTFLAHHQHPVTPIIPAILAASPYLVGSNIHWELKT